jgi:hypothetical protein
VSASRLRKEVEVITLLDKKSDDLSRIVGGFVNKEKRIAYLAIQPDERFNDIAFIFRRTNTRNLHLVIPVVQLVAALERG